MTNKNVFKNGTHRVATSLTLMGEVGFLKKPLEHLINIKARLLTITTPQGFTQPTFLKT